MTRRDYNSCSGRGTNMRSNGGRSVELCTTVVAPMLLVSHVLTPVYTFPTPAMRIPTAAAKPAARTLQSTISQCARIGVELMKTNAGCREKYVRARSSCSTRGRHTSSLCTVSYDTSFTHKISGFVVQERVLCGSRRELIVRPRGDQGLRAV